MVRVRPRPLFHRSSRFVESDPGSGAGLQSSLSRLNHWLPWGQTDPEVMQSTAQFHHQITDACFPEAEAVFDDATTLDTAVDVLDPQPTPMQRLVRGSRRNGRKIWVCPTFYTDGPFVEAGGLMAYG